MMTDAYRGRPSQPSHSSSPAQSLIFRFTLLACLSVATVIAFAVVTYQGVRGLSASNDSMQVISQVIQRHMEGDMMHDAINSDVLKGKIAASENNTEDLAAATASLNEDAANFRKNVTENLAEEMPDAIKAKLVEVEKALNAYVDAARVVLAALAKGEKGAEAFATFEEKFTFLEEMQEAVSEDLVAWSADYKQVSGNSAQRTAQWIVILASIALALAIGTPLYTARGVFRPLRLTIDKAAQIAGGKTDIVVPYTDAGNEIGEMARAVDIFRENLLKAQELEQNAQAARDRAQADRKRALAELADQFERSVGGVISAVSHAAADLQSAAEALSSASSQTTQQSGVVATAAERAAANVSTVAAAAEELSSSIREISRQVSESANMAHQAVQEAEQTTSQVSGLSIGAQKIGAIVDLINDIASKTNLLALNATIEAARAGEAGKGFAVVAVEVKALAEQTAKATAEITGHIGAVQSSTDLAANAILGIGKTIDSINHIAAAVAAAVEEQGTATEEIARNVDQAARGTTDVTRNVTGMSQSAQTSSTSASKVLASATELARQSETLRGEMQKFLATVRAA